MWQFPMLYGSPSVPVAFDIVVAVFVVHSVVPLQLLEMLLFVLMMSLLFLLSFSIPAVLFHYVNSFICYSMP